MIRIVFINMFFLLSFNLFAFNDFSFNSAFHRSTAGAFKSHSESLQRQRKDKANRRGLFLKGKGYINTLGGDIYRKKFYSNESFNAIHLGLCGFYFYDKEQYINKYIKNVFKYDEKNFH